jgi:ABC-type lipoprotein release transport system permease subunit
VIPVGRLLLLYRLGVRDLRRRPGQALLLLLAIAGGAATLSLGLDLRGTIDNPYARTRAATAGPDVVATVFADGGNAAGPAAVAKPGSQPVTTGSDQATAALRALAQDPAVAAAGGPFPISWAVLRAGSVTGSAEIEGRDMYQGAVDRPQLRSGSWIRPGGVVVEAGFASALGLRTGQRITVGGVDAEIVGTAVTAAVPAYPNTCTAEGCFLANAVAAHNPGLVWSTIPDAARIAGIDGPQAWYLNLRLADSSAATAFVARHANPDAVLLTWSQIRDGDAQTLAHVREVLLFGSWLLALLAVASVAVLVGGRMTEQTRRVGLVKAVGGTPGLVAIVLLVEHVVVGLAAAAAGLLAGWLAAPLVNEPGAGLLGAAGAPAMTGAVVALVAAFALAVAVASTLVPAVRAARQSTVAALNDAARAPRRHAGTIRLTTHLPASLLLGVRLAIRRPRRLILNTASIAVTSSGLVTVLTYHATVGQWRNDPGVTHATTVISAMLVVLAAINAIFIAWTTALDARHSAALSRALGATPHQITSGLAAAQTIPAVIGAMLGIPGGIGFYTALKSGGTTTWPSPLWLLTIVVATVAGIAVLSFVPSRIGLRRPAADALRAG